MNDAVERMLLEEGEAIPKLSAAARASMVNRTRRVVRERALAIADQRSRARSLWLPLTVCSGLLVIICTAVWSLLDEYELTPNGIPDASDQFLVLLLWFLPVSMALLALVWFRRNHTSRAGKEFTR
ncbi:MAG TPA: hypothetical protein VF214_00610 [Edaphobacter sp.]